MRLNPLLQTDFYKIVHKESYKEGLEYLTSYWTARKSRVENVDKIVFFGLQGIIKEKLIEDFEENFFKRPIEEIHIVGLVTNICVLSNAIICKTALPEAKIVIHEDLINSYDEEAHYRALKTMKDLQMEIV